MKIKKAGISKLINGKRFEKENCASINLCFFNILVRIGDVKGIFVGHDHLNNYCAPFNGIKLGYAGYTGYTGYGKHDIARGANIHY